MAISLQIPNSLSFMDVIGIAGFAVTYLAFVFGLLLVGVPMLISDKDKRLVGWLCVISGIIILVAGPFAWYLVAYNKWEWLARNWESVFRIFLFVGYCGFFTAYRRAMRRVELARQTDCEWSASPENYIKVRPTECVFGKLERSILFDLEVSNDFCAQRTVWISGNVAVYRKGVLENSNPICVIPMCICSVDVPAKAMKTVTQPLHSNISSDSAEIIHSILKIDNVIEAKLIDVKITTLINMSSTPETVTLRTCNLLMKPIPVMVLV